MRLIAQLTAVLVLGLLSGGCELTGFNSFDSAELENSSVRIFSLGVGSGSGFIVSDQGDIVTNHHVTHGAKRVFVLHRVGTRTRLYECDVKREDAERDLAVLSSSIKANPLKITTVEPAKPSKVRCMGYPGVTDANSKAHNEAFGRAIGMKMKDEALRGEGVDMTQDLAQSKLLGDMVNASFPEGNVRRLAHQSLIEGGRPIRVIDADLNVGHGNSGGPLLDAAGYVIGVVGTAKIHSDGMDVDKVQWVISARDELIDFLNQTKVKFHTVDFDASKMGRTQKLLISLAGACGLVAIGLGIFLALRKAPATSTPTVVLEEKLRRIMGGAGTPAPAASPHPPPLPPDLPKIEAVWEIDIAGADAFQQRLRLTESDFKKGRGRVVLGRSADFSQVQVKHESVSRQHLHFELQNGSLHVADRHSSNGTKVNGTPLPGPFRKQQLREGDRLQFGALTASIRRGF